MTELNDAHGARATGSDSRLLDAFREIYAEVMLRARALHSPEPPDPDAVKHRLLGVLARQAADAKDALDDHELAELREAQYVMVAMADEVILRRPWVGREAWAAHPLEAERPFHSQVAGERIFQKIDEILAGRGAASAALVGVYITALSLGFRGRYRFDPASVEPQRHRRELIRYLIRLDPRAAAPRPELCPAAVERVRDRERRREVTSLREGLLPMLAAVLTMLVLGHALWYYRTIGVRDQLDRIEEAREQIDAPRPPRDDSGKLNLVSEGER
jgi:type VI secretion system protein ImpK